MLYLDDLKYNKIYKKKFYLPVDKKNIKKNSAILLLSPDYKTSMELMNNPLIINKSKSFHSYYIEKDIMYTIQHESRNLQIDHYDYTAINESASVYTETTDIKNYDNLNEDSINEFYCKLGDKVIFFNEMYDEEVYTEATKGLNNKYKTLLYNDRIRNNKEMFRIYNEVKKDNPWIDKTFISLNKYKQLNLFVDLYYYNQAYLNNNHFTVTKSIDMYFEFIRRFINDRRITKAGYTKRTVFVPINGWSNELGAKIFDYNKLINPLSVIYKKLKLSMIDLQKAFPYIDFIFFGNGKYFKMNFANLKTSDYTTFARLVTKLVDNSPVVDDESDNSKDGITTSIINKLEKNKGIKIHSLTGEKVSNDEQENMKAELVEKINKAAENSVDEDETLDKLEEDQDAKKLLSDLEDYADDNIKLSATRLNRINKAQDELMNKKLNGKTIKELVNETNKPQELPETELPIKTINDEWKHLKAINFESTYDLNADIIRCLNSLSSTDKYYPVSILSVDISDASTTEDDVFLYTVKCESFSGKRFTLKFYIPKLRDNRFMRLRGNEKIFSIELPLLPISKTDDDTVQICTFYNKIFVRRYYTSSGKSNPFTDRLVKALNKYDGKNIKITTGDASRICTKYDLPIDYVDLASNYYRIDTGDLVIYFNQDEIRENPKVNLNKGIPIGVYKNGEICYFTEKDKLLSEFLYEELSNKDSKFKEIFEVTKPGKKYTYSRASILNTNIPIIVILAHDLGLTKALDLAKIKYTIDDKKVKDPSMDSIKFEDFYLNYEISYSSLMLLNGLKDCDTENITISRVNSKVTWVNELENFGGRIKSDGLDNFKDLMYDPVSIEVSRDYKLPDNYHEALIYASNLLVDNKYVKHTDLSSNRYRTNEVIAAQFYRVLSSSYKDYALQSKHGRDVAMTMNINGVLDMILSQNTTSDLSVFQPLMEIETKNTISTKGVTGLNSERAYSIDKRGYDSSMVNVIAQATGFANTVGVNRQTTINPNIVGGRGYIKQSGVEEMNDVNTLCMTEALSPFIVTSDDIFRNDMTFTQTSKHSTPIEYGTPSLVTTGADAAMPYLCSNMFCHKSKEAGAVEEIVENQYMLIKYKDGTSEYVDLSEQTMKNSDGGHYITLQLKTDLKVGNKVKKNTILAYDKKSFSNRLGDKSQVSYNLGCLTKCAILTSEDGFEDSGVASEFLSEAMSSDIVVMKNINLPASTNVLHLAKVGDHVTEGQPICIFQNAYDEEDANLLLKYLNNEDGDVSELGRITLKAKVTGVISDIKIYRTVEKDELSESLRKICNKRESEIKKYKKIADKCENEVRFDSVETLPMVGKLKNVDGVRIEIYIKYHDKLSIGDKLSSNANKVILMNVYSDDDAPYTDFRPEEKIDLVNSCSAIDGRQITSIIKLGALNKLLLELSRKSCDMLGVKWNDLHEMYYDDMGIKK